MKNQRVLDALSKAIETLREKYGFSQEEAAAIMNGEEGSLIVLHRATGQAVRSLREEAGLSQEELAAQGICDIKEIESGERDLHLTELFNLSKLLNVPTQLLMEEIELSLREIIKGRDDRTTVQ